MVIGGTVYAIAARPAREPGERGFEALHAGVKSPARGAIARNENSPPSFRSHRISVKRDSREARRRSPAKIAAKKFCCPDHAAGA